MLMQKIFLISVFSLYELFSAFIYANNNLSLANSLFRAKTLIAVLSFTSSLSPSRGGTGGKSANFPFSSLFSVVSSHSFSINHPI